MRALALVFTYFITASALAPVNSVVSHRQNISDRNIFENYNFENGLVTTAELEKAEFIIKIVIKPIVCVSGFVLNIIGICVLLQKQFRHSSYQYLLALMISDCGFLLCNVIQVPVDVIELTDEVYSSYLTSIIAPVTKLYAEQVLTKVSSYIICFLALERLVAVSLPLRAEDLVLSRHARKINIAIFVVVFVLYIPIIFERHFVYKFIPNKNVSMYVLEKICYDDATESFLAFHRYAIKAIVMMYIPVSLLLLFNICVLTQLAVIRKRRRTLFRANSEDKIKPILTLVVISLFFLIVYTIMMVVDVLRSRKPQVFSVFRKEHNFMTLMHMSCSFGWSLNSANDFIIYLATNRKFRGVFCAMCCRNRPGNRSRTITPPPYSITVSSNPAGSDNV